MPQGDPRRVAGPESSNDYRAFASQKKTQGKKSTNGKELHIKEILKRSDGRDSPDKHRPLFLDVGVIGHASGSAYVEQGSTKVICAVYGPREIPRRSDFSMKSGVLACKIEHAPFSRPQRVGRWRQEAAESESRDVSGTIKEALEATVCMHLYPKTQIDVFITVLENDGCVVAAALTCASLALANASVQMFDLTIGASIKRVVDSTSYRYTDPTLEEESMIGPDGSSCLTIGYQPSSEQISCLLHEGWIDKATMSEDIDYLTGLCNNLLPNLQKCLVNSIQKDET